MHSASHMTQFETITSRYVPLVCTIGALFPDMWCQTKDSESLAGNPKKHLEQRLIAMQHSK